MIALSKPVASLPVLVGVSTTGVSADIVDLLELVMRGAVTDAGADSRLVASIGEVAIPRGSWADVNPARIAAARLGSTAPVVIADVGVLQQALISRVLGRVGNGEIDAGLVVGVEARRWLAAGGTAGGVVGRLVGDDGTVPPEIRLQPHGEIVNAAEIAAQVWEPVQQYALIDSALAHADGVPAKAWEAEIDDLWARWNAVAVDNPESAFATPRDAAALRSGEQGNRLLAHPYRRFHSTQWNLDQATALLICSTDAARRLAISVDRWVFPHASLEYTFAAAVEPTRAAPLAGHAGARRGGCGPSRRTGRRNRSHRSVQLFPGGRAGAATRTRARRGWYPHDHRWDAIRWRSVQPLHALVDGGDGPPTP